MLNNSFVEYKDAIQILETTSKHISLVVDIIKKEVLPNLVHRQKFLDVGAGAGKLTKILQKEFIETTAVEVNPELKSCYDNTGIKLYNSDFMQTQFAHKFDLVLCCHVLYHLNHDAMTAFIEKLLSLVNTDGFCFIVLMAPRGQNHQFHEVFNPHYISSQQVIDILNQKHIQYKKIAVSNSFTTDSFSKMKNLLKFFTIEDCLMKPADALSLKEIQNIETIVEQQTKECDITNSYELKQEEDYFIISLSGHCHSERSEESP